MKTVIFAGGFGTRISEESHLKPKPMIEVGGKPILWHIMKIYEHYGHTEFIICLGYKGYVIKEYFMNYFMHNADVTIDLEKNETEIHASKAESFKITLVETGLHTKTAGRLKRIKQYVDGERFMLTYGDGLSDLDINDLLSFHEKHGKIATVTTILPEGKFGAISTNKDGVVEHFMEKPKGDGSWINGGFFVLEPEVFKYLDGNMDDVMWEESPLHELTQDRQLVSYKYNGFWKCMDALRDKMQLEQMWNSEKTPWKKW
ncbi:MAG: glucose-1-phosphate cytidylyltransferase [Bacteroidetes bacterium]|nr:glucose-1-phosphate cytidylyltransferase [Bacteroidota bacterium]